MSLIGGGGNTDNWYVTLLLTWAVVALTLMPLCISIYHIDTPVEVDENEYLDNLNAQYKEFTGSEPVSESVWGLTGIYTPFTGGSYGYTPDGWLYGSKVHDYTPSQYSQGETAYTVTDRDTSTGTVVEYPVYRYSDVADISQGISVGDTYTSVAFDTAQKSDIFFSESGKVSTPLGYYYEYSGYRYAFSPLTNVYGWADNGEQIEIVANTSSLSLIWYSYYGNDGIAGQLIISGSDSGVSYLTANEIVQAFNSTTNTSKFVMKFNGVSCNLYVKLDPYYTSAGMSVAECYEQGYWSVMVTSQSVNISSYTSTDYKLSIYNIRDTVWDLLTFDLDSYGFSPLVSSVCSIVFVAPLYIGMISLGMTFTPVLIGAGALAVLQGISWLGGLF